MPATNESVFTFQIRLCPPRTKLSRPSLQFRCRNFLRQTLSTLSTQAYCQGGRNPGPLFFPYVSFPLPTPIRSTQLKISQTLFYSSNRNQTPTHTSNREPTRPTLFGHSVTRLDSSPGCEFQFLSPLRAPDELSPEGMVCSLATKREECLWRLGRGLGFLDPFERRKAGWVSKLKRRLISKL